MQLFFGDTKYQEADGLDSVITTPLGDIGFYFTYEDTELTSFLSVSYFLESNGYILRWSNEDVEAELLICRPYISLPENYSVKECFATLWRIKAKRNLENIRFNAFWKKGYIWTNEGTESGEHVDAMTWDDGKTKVTLGTQDGEVIASRILNNLMMPAEIDKNIAPIGLVKYHKYGLVVPLERIYLNKVCQLHFVVAWSDCDPENIGTWYAVDMS